MYRSRAIFLVQACCAHICWTVDLESYFAHPEHGGGRTLNFDQINAPFPLNVDVALQYKWFSHGLIQSATASHPLILASFDNTLRTSVEKFDGKFSDISFPHQIV